MKCEGIIFRECDPKLSGFILAVIKRGRHVSFSLCVSIITETTRRWFSSFLHAYIYLFFSSFSLKQAFYVECFAYLICNVCTYIHIPIRTYTYMFQTNWSSIHTLISCCKPWPASMLLLYDWVKCIFGIYVCIFFFVFNFFSPSKHLISLYTCSSFYYIMVGLFSFMLKNLFFRITFFNKQ